MLRQTLLATAMAASLSMVATPSVAAPVSVFVDIGPPALRHEEVPAARRGYDWTPGYWAWNGNRNRHNWVAGSWVHSRPGYVYAQPNWVERDGRWHQQRGAWTRGDRDHDGIRNSRDRDRDGDGVPNRRDSAPDNPRRN